MREFKERKKPSTSSDAFFKPTVQTKLAVGQAGDQYEQEADATADRVVNGTNSTSASKGTSGDGKPLAAGISSVQMKEIAPAEDEKAVQKKEEEKEPVQKKEEEKKEEPIQKKEEEEKPVQKKEEPAEEEKVQKKEEEKKDETVQKKEEEKQEEPVQKKEEEQKEESIQKKEEEEQPVQKKGNNAAASPKVESRLGSRKGKGNELGGSVKNEMEKGFGADFGDVRIHNDSEATQMAGEMGAQAFTHGNDIYFNKGKFDPQSKAGKELLAHELTHTIQQEGLSEQNIQRKGEEETENVPQVESTPTEENEEKPGTGNTMQPDSDQAEPLAKRRRQIPIMGGDFSHQLSGRFNRNSGSPSELIITSRDLRESFTGCNAFTVTIDGVEKAIVNSNSGSESRTRTVINISDLPAGAHSIALTMSPECSGTIHVSVMGQ